MNATQTELDGIARFVRDSGNACGCSDNGWEWDADKQVLTITEQTGKTTTINGADIAASCPHDHRLDRLRTE